MSLRIDLMLRLFKVQLRKIVIELMVATFLSDFPPLFSMEYIFWRV